MEKNHTTKTPMSNTTPNTQHMTAEEAVQILREYNEWRRGTERYAQPLPHDPRTLGIAIDTACDAITALQQQLAGSEQAVATQRNAICNLTKERDRYKAALSKAEVEQENIVRQSHGFCDAEGLPYSRFSPSQIIARMQDELIESREYKAERDALREDRTHTERIFATVSAENKALLRRIVTVTAENKALREAIVSAIMHLDTNCDIDGNSMADSDAANVLKSAIDAAKEQIPEGRGVDLSNPQMQITGHTLCRKCDRFHWMHGPCAEAKEVRGE